MWDNKKARAGVVGKVKQRKGKSEFKGVGVEMLTRAGRGEKENKPNEESFQIVFEHFCAWETGTTTMVIRGNEKGGGEGGGGVGVELSKTIKKN